MLNVPFSVAFPKSNNDTANLQLLIAGIFFYFGELENEDIRLYYLQVGWKCHSSIRANLSEIGPYDRIPYYGSKSLVLSLLILLRISLILNFAYIQVDEEIQAALEFQ